MTSQPDYARDLEVLKDFVGHFRSEGAAVPKYMGYVVEVGAGTRTVVPIEMDDMLAYRVDAAPGEEPVSMVDLVTRCQSNTHRYVGLFEDAVAHWLPDPSVETRESAAAAALAEAEAAAAALAATAAADDPRSQSQSQSHTHSQSQSPARGGTGQRGGGGGGGGGQGARSGSGGSATEDRELRAEPDEDPSLVLYRQAVARAREQRALQSAASGMVEAVEDISPEELGFAKELGRRFEVRLLPQSTMRSVPLRHVRSSDLGHLIKVRAMVTRVTDVKPLLRVASYHCARCQADVFQTVNQRQFVPLLHCPSEACKGTGGGQLFLVTRACKFQKYQEARIQEMPEHVPVGHIPRTMTVVVRGDLTRSLSPGDDVTIAGVFTPAPYTGFRAMRAGLLADTFLEAHQFAKRKSVALDRVDGGAGEGAAREIENALDDMAGDPDIYSKLARSIAPEIWGHEDVKRVLLLQLVGGVTRAMGDGMRIRGDINVCLVGDPGVAKSQLLKHVTRVAKRAVYTTGKGSSGVGLTAAVLKDPVTGEMSLEGGALVLADTGICCIDEFDKMEDADRTAIHEVMEQQTVSIAKAGITTTLNARTAILAAANPLYGRYNERLHKDPTQNLLRNINLPAALLSRFDIVWVLRDKEDTDNDLALARHVTFVHQRETTPPLGFEPISDELLREYIAAAKLVDPVVPRALADHIVEQYVQLRARENAAAKAAADNGRGVLTARQLLSILRMAQALARIGFRDQVEDKDVEEAMRLVRTSKDAIFRERETAYEDPKSRIFGLIRELLTAANKTSIAYSDVLGRVARAGFSEEQLADTLAEYEALDVLRSNAARTRIDLVGAV